MPTNKKRINITADRDVERALVRAAKRDGIPVASKAAELISTALELEEDIYFSALAHTRASKRATYYAHRDAWK